VEGFQMKILFLIIVLTGCLFDFLIASVPFEWQNGELIIRRLNMKQEVLKNIQENQDVWQSQTGEQRSIKKAILFSLMVPGSGQFYANSYLKGALFLTVEAGAWMLNISYTKKGDDKDREFKAYAEKHWSDYRYWSYVAYRASSVLEDPPISSDEFISANNGKWFLIPENQFTPAMVSQLREIEGKIQTFSHRLPETKTQQYYEMIGKYPAQFGYAWDDADFNRHYSGYTGDYTPRNNFYMDMRDEANRLYNIAGYGTMVALINHIVSAFDAGFTARRFNRNHAVKIKMSYKSYLLKNEYVNMFGINFNW
jgi:hypothetical protein